MTQLGSPEGLQLICGFGPARRFAEAAHEIRNAIRSAGFQRGGGLERIRRSFGVRLAPMPELFEAAGIEFDFTAATLGPLVDAMTKDMERFYGSVDVWRGRT